MGFKLGQLKFLLENGADVNHRDEIGQPIPNEAVIEFVPGADVILLD